MEIKFKRDTAFRKQFFVPDSFAHPAKMDAQLLIWIVERYTEPAETILDPMAGSGTTLLACTLSRNVILVELEEKFIKMCQDNWELVKMKPQLYHGMGWCQIIQGDARQLEGLVDKIVTSPPYAEVNTEIGRGRAEKFGKNRYLDNRYYSKDPQNIGNLPYGQIDKIVASPPYEKVVKERGADNYAIIEEKGLDMSRAYSGSPDNIGNLKSQSYLEAMLQVYQQCHKVLKPQGLMMLVTKNFIRNKQVVRLDLDTIGLCQRAGFSSLERHYRKLPSQSFWRIIYAQKHPEVEQILYEDILVFVR